jgi:hypothetical protein
MSSPHDSIFVEDGGSMKQDVGTGLKAKFILDEDDAALPETPMFQVC